MKHYLTKKYIVAAGLCAFAIVIIAPGIGSANNHIDRQVTRECVSEARQRKKVVLHQVRQSYREAEARLDRQPEEAPETQRRRERLDRSFDLQKKRYRQQFRNERKACRENNGIVFSAK